MLPAPAENYTRPHPLMLYPVIKCFMEYANYRDLCVTRQVCRLWRSETQCFLSKKTKININGNTMMKLLLKEYKYLSQLPCTTYNLTNINSGHLKAFCTRTPLVKHLLLDNCELNNSDLRILVFKYFPGLVSLTIRLTTVKNPRISAGAVAEENDNLHLHQRRFNNSNCRILPMSIGSLQGSLKNLREFELTGDFSKKTDVIFDILKNAPHLEKIVCSKNLPTEDDLFGTWFTEICLSLGFKQLKCLELQSPLIESQVDLLMFNTFPIRRMALNFCPVPFEKLIRTLEKFKLLESVEVGLENVHDEFVGALLKRFKNSSFWIAIHSNFDTKLIFPAHAYVISENRV